MCAFSALPYSMQYYMSMCVCNRIEEPGFEELVKKIVSLATGSQQSLISHKHDDDWMMSSVDRCVNVPFL